MKHLWWYQLQLNKIENNGSLHQNAVTRLMWIPLIMLLQGLPVWVQYREMRRLRLIFQHCQKLLESNLHCIQSCLQFISVFRWPWNKEVLIESHCAIAVSEIAKGKESFYIQDSIFADILDMLPYFESCSVSHISRNANVLAHNLAKVHREVGDHRLWRNSLPPFLCNDDYVFI